MKIFNSIEELVGKTPMLKLLRFSEEYRIGTPILAKVEAFNPAGSIKDRAAKQMIDAAEKDGILKAGGVIIEPTSGNTGIGIAAIAAVRGYKAIIVMPDTMSKERILLMRAYGAEVVLSDGKFGMAGAIKKAEELKESIKDSFIVGQFTNPANSDAHYKTTGPEIWADTDGKIDILVSGVGTGGTITGTGKYLKEQNPKIKVVAVEPASSAILSGESAGAHGLQGIGAGFIPKVLDTSIYDEIVKVKDEDAFAASRLIAKTEGIIVGITSGAALYAAVELAKMPQNKGKNIVVILPDTGERYLSTALFDSEE